MATQKAGLPRVGHVCKGVPISRVLCVAMQQMGCRLQEGACPGSGTDGLQNGVLYMRLERQYHNSHVLPLWRQLPCLRLGASPGRGGGGGYTGVPLPGQAVLQPQLPRSH